MEVKASNFKNWCTKNISPQSWTRICLKCVDEIRAKGYKLKEMEDLDVEIYIDDDLLKSLNIALSEYYAIKVNEESLMTTDP